MRESIREKAIKDAKERVYNPPSNVVEAVWYNFAWWSVQSTVCFF